MTRYEYYIQDHPSDPLPSPTQHTHAEIKHPATLPITTSQNGTPRP